MTDDDNKFIEKFKKSLKEAVSHDGGNIYFTNNGATRFLSIIESLQARKGISIDQLIADQDLNRPLMGFLRSIPSGYQIHLEGHTFIPLKRYCDTAADVIEFLQQEIERLKSEETD